MSQDDLSWVVSGRPRILVIGSRPGAQQLAGGALRGFEVLAVADGVAGVRAIEESKPDIVIIDFGVPPFADLALLTEVRARANAAHILVLTGGSSERGRIAGLLSGADDCIAEPFSAEELRARVVSAARRRGPGLPGVMDLGELRIDVAKRSVNLRGVAVDLTRREFDLLYYLASNAGMTLSRERLLDAVWNSSARWQSAATVTEHVRRVRAKLGSDVRSPRITTIRGLGYRFDLPLVPDGTAQAVPPESAATAPSGAVLVLVGAIIVEATEAALEVLGADRKGDVVGKDIFSFIGEQSLPAGHARIASSRGGQYLRPELLVLLRVDRSEVLVEVSSSAVSWRGEPASQVNIWSSESSTSRLRHLAIGVAAEVSDAVIITSNDFRIRSVNPAAEKLYGWLEHEVLDRAVTEVIPWGGPAHDMDTAASDLASAGHWHGRVVQIRRDGSPVEVLASATTLRSQEGLAVGVVSVNRQVLPATEGSRIGGGHDASLVADIRRGLDLDEFDVYYQPVFALADRRILGVEALARWHHPQRGLLQPASFIDAAERSGAIVELGRVVLEKTCRQVATWRAAGHDLHAAINLSTRQLSDTRLLAQLQEVTRANAIPAGVLWLEVTETALVGDLDQATALLRGINDLGACLSIDDFGTGWASLTYLRHFPVHALKIDRVFVAGLGVTPNDSAIVRSIISLAAELDLAVIAEGIETDAQLATLVAFGCPSGQGYRLGRPVPPHELLPHFGQA